MDTMMLGLVWYAVFLFSLVFHEFAHSVVAYRLGDSTAFDAGQVTLDPRPHMKREIWGTVVVPIVSYAIGGWMFGWASAPVDPHWTYDNPRKSAWVSFAGPLSNLLLVLLAGAAIRLGIAAGWMDSPYQIGFSHVVEAPGGGVMAGVSLFLSILFSLNILLFIFNLLPLPPLDGSGMVPFFVSDDKARRFMDFIYGSPIQYVGIFIAWRVFGDVFPPFHSLFIDLLYPGMYG